MADMEDDNDTNEPDNDADDQEGAIPTSDSADNPEPAQDDTGGQTGAAGATGAQPAPGAAQSPGSALSELLALVRAVQSYGMKQAMQQGQPTQQAASFEDGGSTTPPEEDDTTGAIPTAAPQTPQTPQTPEEEGFATRQKALDKSTLGGAFGAAQQQKLNQARQDYTSQQGSGTNTAGGEHDFSNSPSPSEQQQSNMGGFIPPHQAIQNVASKGMENLKRYLSGDKAMDPNSVAGIGYAVDPQGTLPPVEKKMKMIQYAYQRIMEHTGDPREAMNGALGVFQHQRQEYGMWLTGAAVKLDQGDMGSALHAANQAFQAPFGENVHFAQSGGGTGVTATVTDDKGKVQGTFAMAPDQFSMLLHKHAQFDALAANGVFNTFSQMSGPMGEPQGPQQPSPQAQGPQGPQQPPKRSDADIDAEYAKPNGGNLTDEEVRQHDERHYPIMRAPEGVDRKLFDQSNRIFPMLSQNQHREAWIAQEQEKEAGRKSKEDIANRTAEGRLAIAKATQDAAMGRTQARDNASMERTQYREGEHDKRSENYWEKRTKEFMIREAGKAQKDPNAAGRLAVVKDALAQHSGDPEGFHKALKDQGLDYERDILARPSTQQTPATPAQSGAPQGAPAGGGTTPGVAGKAPPGAAFKDRNGKFYDKNGNLLE